MTREVVWALLLFAALVASAAAGSFLRSRLPEPHRNQETIEFLRIVTALLVTFIALVMSLLLASELSSYDSAYHDRNHYAASLAELDGCMRDFGPPLGAARQELHSYTAAVIASTWPDEPRPQGVDYPDTSKFPLVGEVPALNVLINKIGLALAGVAPKDPFHQAIAQRCSGVFHDVVDARWSVIEDAHGSLSAPFAAVLLFWMVLVFLSFGLQGPRNLLATFVIGIAVISVTSVMFVILDLDLPYGGLFGIPSTSMRLALSDMLR